MHMIRFLFFLLFLTSCSTAESFPAWAKRVFALDGYTAEHCLTGSLIGSTFSNDGVAEYLYWKGLKKTPHFSDMDAIWASTAFNFVWEVIIEYGIDTGWNYDKWCAIYGGEKEAWRNNLVDVGVVTLSAWLATEKYWVRDVLFWFDDPFHPGRWRATTRLNHNGLTMEIYF